MSQGAHPSRLALDRYALGARSEAVAAHAQGCAQCAAHLKAVRVELPLPAWVGELEAPRPVFLGWLKPLALGASLATAALVGAVVFTPGGPDGVTAKGTGAVKVQVWVNRGGRASLWDGAALSPDDALRFEVKPAGFRHLTVVELKGGALYRVLHAAPVGDGLSPAWAVDDQGDHDEVAVLLSMAPLSQEELQEALAGRGSAWVGRWSFAKEVR